MAKLFDVTILTPLKTVYKGKASSLVAPAQTGYLGILANHAPMVTTIGGGKISLKEESGSTRTILCQGNGLLEVVNDHVTLLLEVGAA